MRNDSRRRERSTATFDGNSVNAVTLVPFGLRGDSFDGEAERWRWGLRRLPRRPDPDGPGANMVWTVELVVPEPAGTSRPKPTPRRLRKRPDMADSVPPNWAKILVGGAIVAAALSLVLDSYWGGMLLSASMFTGMISVANQRGARMLADLGSRRGDGLISGSEYETEREDIIHPPVPDYWSQVG